MQKRPADQQEEREASSSSSSLNYDRLSIKQFLPGLLLDIILPALIYFLLKQVTSSDLVALSVASVVPLLDGLLSIVRRHSLDILTALVLLGAATSVLVMLLGGNAWLLLVQGSFFTGVLGLACLVSLVFPRPALYL